MVSKNLERLVGRAILNREFRERLFAGPETVIQKEGQYLIADDLAQLQKVDKEKAMTLAEEREAVPEEAWK